MFKYSKTIFSHQCEYFAWYILISCRLLILHLPDSVFHFISQLIRAFLVCIYFLFSFELYVSWSIRSVVELCNIILSNCQYLSLIYYYIPLKECSMTVFQSHDNLPTYILRVLLHYIITSCTLKSHDIVIYALKVSLLGLVCGSFQFVLKFSIVLPSLLTLFHFLRSSIFLIT